MPSEKDETVDETPAFVITHADGTIEDPNKKKLRNPLPALAIVGMVVVVLVKIWRKL